MSLVLNSALMERLAEGVILLNPQGQVTDYNRAARPWLKTCLAGTAALGELMGKVASGTVQLPLRVDSIFAPAAGTTDFHLCKNEPHNFALLITAHQPPTAALPEVAAQDSFFFLLGEDFRHELSRLREQITTAAPDIAAQLARVQQQSGRLSRLLIAMEQLCELHEKDAFFQGERVNLRTLSEAVIAELPRRRGDFSINQAQSDATDQQGMLFGDAGWLKIALKGLLEGIAAEVVIGCSGYGIFDKVLRCRRKRIVPIHRALVGGAAPSGYIGGGAVQYSVYVSPIVVFYHLMVDQIASEGLAVNETEG